MSRVAIAMVSGAMAFLCCSALAADRGADDRRGIKLTADAEKIVGKDISIPNYHALVIGINRYQDSTWPQLRKARADATPPRF